MNKIRQIQALNKRELEAGVSLSASWHNDYRDTAFIYIGGLPLELSEGDVVTIFSQYGEPTYINLVRDKETGKSRGFCFLKYEDQRSTDLAVDNLSGATIMGRMLSVDHTRYKKRDDEELVDNTNGVGEETKVEEIESDGRDRKARRRGSSAEEERPLLKEEKELAELRLHHDEDDPMKEFLIQEKKEEVEAAINEYERSKKGQKKDERRHHGRHHHSRRHERESDEPRSKNSTEDRGERRRRRSRSDTPTRDSDEDSRRRRHRSHR